MFAAGDEFSVLSECHGLDADTVVDQAVARDAVTEIELEIQAVFLHAGGLDVLIGSAVDGYGIGVGIRLGAGNNGDAACSEGCENP